ncbi:hypothetical protein KFE94_05005 [bacterium SCSIO 12643]|nr:hypothetical protein KFE94_05005 [bacterium SCSIO 12643]
MKRIIKRYYLNQLIIGFVLTFTTINLIGLVNQTDSFSVGHLSLLSIVGGFLFSIANALINSLNFSFPNKQNHILAFYIPILLWFIPLITSVSKSIENEEFKISDWLIIIIWMEPILYNLALSKLASKTTKSK